jgi:cyclopropane fatty-acyl-phospholipid synthase-like methyltransferase
VLDSHKIRSVGLATRRYAWPLSQSKAQSLLAALDLQPEHLLLDLASGSGALLFDAVCKYGCRGMGLMHAPGESARAASAARAAGLSDRLVFIDASLGEDLPQDLRADAVICTDSVRVFGELEPPISHAFRVLRTGGRLLLGEYFWRRRPPPGYRDLFDLPAARVASIGANASSAVNAGFDQKLTALASESEWDNFENAYYRACLSFAEVHRDDTDSSAIRDRAHARYQAYWRYGRDCLGFGFHIFRKPAHRMTLVAATEAG